jgi:hypothetical protein
MDHFKNRKDGGFSNSHLIKDPNYIIPEEEYEEETVFKANPVPNYPDVQPIVGVNEHLERMQKSRENKKTS